MKIFHSVIILAHIFCSQSVAQSGGPYKLRLGIDLPVTVGLAGASYFGLQHLRDKKRIDSALVASLTPDDVNKFDRGATRQNSKTSGTNSNIALYSSFLLPLVIIADKSIRSDALKIGALYLETMSVMANAYTWGVSSTKRIRPYVYNPDVPWKQRTGRGAYNSFFAGHPASAAASTFFAAKVFSDYHPHSRLRPYIWVAAVIPPSIIGYYRYRQGQHFPTDILVGIPLGAVIGIIIPHLHKKSNKTNLSIYPVSGPYNGVVLNYRFK